MGGCLEGCDYRVHEECLCPRVCAECEKWGTECEGCFERGEIHSLIVFQVVRKLENFSGISDEKQKECLEKLKRE